MNAKICTGSMQILDLLLCDLVGGFSTVWNGFTFFCGVLVLLVDLSVSVTSPLTTFFCLKAAWLNKSVVRAVALLSATMYSVGI